MKKLTASLLAAVVITLALAGCAAVQTGDVAEPETAVTSLQSEDAGSDQKGSETKDNTDTTDSGVIDSSGLIAAGLQGLGSIGDIFTGSSWSGVDLSGNKYVLSLQEGKFTYSVIGKDGEEKQEGSWSLGTDGIDFFASGDLKEELGSIDCSIVLGDKPYLKLNDVYLTMDDVKDYAAQLKNLDIAAAAMEYLSAQGRYWIACGENEAVLISFEDGKLDMRVMSMDGGQILEEANDYDLCVSDEELALFDGSGNHISDYDWSLEDEGELKVFNLDNGTEDNAFYEIGCESAEAGEEMARSYLENEQAARDNDDITTLLKGYEGVSIVDAFVMAGMDPRIENRAIYAEKFGIENYRGTAEQNIFLLKSMGGVVK